MKSQNARRGTFLGLRATFAAPLLAIAVAVGLARSFAQEAPQRAKAPTVSAERAASVYRAEEWPASGPSREGCDPNAVEPRGLVRRSLDVDPFKQTARLTFGPFEARQGDANAEGVALTIRVHQDAAAARLALLDALSSAARKLDRARDLGIDQGDVAFATGDGRGHAFFVALARGNVTATARLLALPQDGLAWATQDRNLRAVVAAWDAAVLAAPALAPGTAVPAPQVRELGARERARAERPNALVVDADATTVYRAYDATNGASVLETRDGPLLYAGGAMRTTVRVAVATKYLGARTVEAPVEVSAAE